MVLSLADPQQHRTHPNQPPIRPVSMPANASIGPPALTLGACIRLAGSPLNARRQPIPHSARGSLVPHFPRFRSLAAFGRRPWCPLTGRVGRHPKPITRAALQRAQSDGSSTPTSGHSRGKAGRPRPRRSLARLTRLRCDRCRARSRNARRGAMSTPGPAYSLARGPPAGPNRRQSPGLSV
jgi:hypothetical protein